MKRNNINKKNLIILSAFSAAFLVIAMMSANFEKKNNKVVFLNIPEDAIESMDAGLANTAQEDDEYVSDDDYAADDYVYDHGHEEVSETVTVSAKEATAVPQRTVFTVTEYETPVTKYTSDTVNVRNGAGTDYDKVGKLKWGSNVSVTGETDNGWYEVSYNDSVAFVKGDYMVDDLPGIPYVFVGDSRTVQLKMAVGTSDKVYIAKVGEGYNYFRDTALPEISGYAGSGTRMIINFGVNDLANASKYIKLVNNNIDSWINAGMTVYYAAVTPVGNCPTVTNAQIEAFNQKLQEELDPRITWIDGYSYLQQTGFNTPDGLHYSADTYRNLYSYYMSVINGQ
jgi:uncharacterized protein YraI